ncbi:hypothetical protein N9B94_02375 [Verrucomicrobia bacterium]|nr:hypothetical protein [Verrucomicrobiota bacterium]
MNTRTAILIVSSSIVAILMALLVTSSLADPNLVEPIVVQKASDSVEVFDFPTLQQEQHSSYRTVAKNKESFASHRSWPKEHEAPCHMESDGLGFTPEQTN